MESEVNDRRKPKHQATIFKKTSICIGIRIRFCCFMNDYSKKKKINVFLAFLVAFTWAPNL